MYNRSQKVLERMFFAKNDSENTVFRIHTVGWEKSLSNNAVVNSYFFFLIVKYNKYANHITTMKYKPVLRRLNHAEYVTKPQSRVLLYLCIPPGK